MAEMVVVPLAYPFTADFVVKGGRVVRRETLLGRGMARVCSAAAEEVEPVYRISAPSAVDQDGFTYDIVRWEDRLWWPLNTVELFWPPSFWSSEACVRELATCRLGLVGLMPQDPPRRVLPGGLRWSDDVAKRSVERSDESDNLAKAQRRVAENLLLVGGQAFVRGGEPVYVCEPALLRAGECATYVASLGPDRTADLDHDDLRRRAGFFDSVFVQASLRTGSFHYREERAAALVAAPSGERPLPAIYLLGVPAPRSNRDTVRLDAIFRHALNFVHELRRRQQLLDREGPRRVMIALADDIEAVASWDKDAMTSFERWRCLGALLDALKDGDANPPIPPFFAGLAQDIVRAMEDGGMRRFERPAGTLSAEDEEAIASLAT
jgi:hypothetical protein